MPAIPSTRANFAPSRSLSALPAVERCAEAAADSDGLAQLDVMLTLRKGILVEVAVGPDIASDRSSPPVMLPIDKGLKTVSTSFGVHLSCSLLRLSLLMDFWQLASIVLNMRGCHPRDDFIMVICAGPEHHE